MWCCTEVNGEKGASLLELTHFCGLDELVCVDVLIRRRFINNNQAGIKLYCIPLREPWLGEGKEKGCATGRQEGIIYSVVV